MRLTDRTQQRTLRAFRANRASFDAGLTALAQDEAAVVAAKEHLILSKRAQRARRRTHCLHLAERLTLRVTDALAHMHDDPATGERLFTLDPVAELTVEGHVLGEHVVGVEPDLGSAAG